MKSNNAVVTPGKPAYNELTGTGPLDFDQFHEFLYADDWHDCVDETKETGTISQDDVGLKDVDAVDDGQLVTSEPENPNQLVNVVNQGDEEPGNTAQDEIEIPQDSFSMFYAANTWQEHLPPFMVFILQIFTLSLIFYNLIQHNGSPLDLQINIPVDVPIEVTMAQVLACIISVYTAGDFVDGLFFIRRPIILSKSRDGRLETKDLSLKWEISNLMRMLEGGCVIAVTSIFIVQSTTVIELFLNFAGVAFVSELDDAHFRLAERDLLGKRARKLADQVSASKVHTDDKKVRGIIRNCLFVMVVVGMLCGLAVVVYRQDFPQYACKSVLLTVGERKFASYRPFSGTYKLDDSFPYESKRAIYVQEQGKGAFIAYCTDTQRWTVTPLFLFDDSCSDCQESDPCCCYELQSERTRTYDITGVRELQFWTGGAADGDIKCIECSMKRGDETCGYNGYCVETDLSSELTQKICQCDPGYFGHSCQFEGPCTELIFEGDEFPGYGKKFQLLYHKNEPLMVHDRPAYIQRYNSSQGTLGSAALLIYDGGRWKVIEVHDDPELMQDIEEFLAEEFHVLTYIDGYSMYISSELSYGGMPNVPFRAHFTMQESDWSFGKLGEEEFNLLCADCWDGNSGVTNCFDEYGDNNDKLCQSETIVLDEGQQEKRVNRCKCPPGFIGPLCQTRPVEGKVQLHLEHGAPNACASCGEHNMWNVWDLLGFDDKTCIPFPREPLIFEGSDGTIVTRQVGLHLDETHFSVFVSDHGRFFPKGNNTGASELICNAQEGSKKIHSIKRSNVPNYKNQIHIDFAVMLNNISDFFGEVVDPGDIDCFTDAIVDENECDGSENGTLAEVYHDPLLVKSNLTRTWIQLDLKVTQ